VPEDGMSWNTFCSVVSEFDEGQIWRYGQAGDLPGQGDDLDVALLDQLVEANAAAGARGFAFTHKPLRTQRERDAVARANARGFTINLSANSPAHATRLKALGIAPVATVVASDAGRSPDYVLCPAETHKLTCATCGLCAVSSRKSVVAFRAGGQFKTRANAVVQLAAGPAR